MSALIIATLAMNLDEDRALSARNTPQKLVTIASDAKSNVVERKSVSSVAIETSVAFIPHSHQYSHSLPASTVGKQGNAIKVLCLYSTALTLSCHSSNVTSFVNGTLVTLPQAHDSQSSMTQLDPRVDELCNRVRALERLLNHALKSLSKVTEETLSGRSPSQVNVSADDDANQFAAQETATDDLSLSSQVAAMGALLSRQSSPKPASGKLNVKTDVLIELPDVVALQHLLDVYFRDMDNYFPFLDRQDTESAIFTAIRRLGYMNDNRMMVVPMEDLSVVALASIMLALAECLDTDAGACDGNVRPGWENYLQSRRAVQHTSHRSDLYTLSTQCLIAAYLMHCEILDAASEAIRVAWKLATSLRVNNKRSWSPDDSGENLQKQKIWWTIYFLDRQISRRSGTAYHIRDTEFNVDEFTGMAGIVSDQISQSDWHTSATWSYLQALINLARLWGHVWDTFFAVGATKKGDWMEIEITDARVVNTRRQLPNSLTWNSEELANYSLNEDEPHIRRRLQLYTVSVSIYCGSEVHQD